MKVTPNPSIAAFSGSLDRIVFYTCYGQVRARSYAVPRDPKTKKQRARRSSFALAVQEWKALSADQKECWNATGKEENRSGHNAFLSARLRGEGAQIRASVRPADPVGVSAPLSPAAVAPERTNGLPASFPPFSSRFPPVQACNDLVSTSMLVYLALGISPYYRK
ncbi:MAG: hypothetical protein EPN93_06345 [Spirochaetes bacterium]|nr:MAG: hypothetical protein EPN93_06345 [Spirochaetota bacterium]